MNLDAKIWNENKICLDPGCTFGYFLSLFMRAQNSSGSYILSSEVCYVI